LNPCDIIWNAIIFALKSKTHRKMAKKLYRSNTDKKLCGVCGGLGEYFDIDSTLIRLLWVILCFVSCGAALLGYLIGALIIPQRPFQQQDYQEPHQSQDS
jgi:phage shock protein PspC (stress-responsive transcriptional regulator)